MNRVDVPDFFYVLLEMSFCSFANPLVSDLYIVYMLLIRLSDHHALIIPDNYSLYSHAAPSYTSYTVAPPLAPSPHKYSYMIYTVIAVNYNSVGLGS